MSYSEGFRDGGFPARFQGGVPNPIPTFEPEFAKSYEIGLKSQSGNNSLRLNGAIFYTDYSDIQVDAISPVGTEFSTTVDNLANAHFSGMELETQLIPSNRWLVNIGVGWLESNIDSVEGGQLVSGSPDTASYTITTANQFPFAPRWNATLGVAYRYRLFYNADLTYKPMRTNWTVSVTVKNLTNRKYSTMATISSVTPIALKNISRPREMFFTVRYHFDENELNELTAP
jgi:iron complex outermembrane recepter protein